MTTNRFSPCCLGHLAHYAISLAEVVNVNVYLASIEDFTRVNAMYGRYFGRSPPSRACISSTMPLGQRICVELIAYKNKQPQIATRRSLHVQSYSYWAPANVGPYSQAIAVRPRYNPCSPHMLTEETGRRCFIYFGDHRTRTFNQPFAGSSMLGDRECLVLTTFETHLLSITL